MAGNANYMAFQSNEKSSNDEQRGVVVCFALMGAALNIFKFSFWLLWVNCYLKKTRALWAKKTKQVDGKVVPLWRQKGSYENLEQELNFHDNEGFR